MQNEQQSNLTARIATPLRSLHTPGPWGDPLLSGAHYSVWKGKTQIAACRWINETTGQPSAECVQSDSEARANARLIAAAPDLLAALQAIVEHDWAANDEGGRNLGRSAQIASAAIAKATKDPQ